MTIDFSPVPNEEHIPVPLRDAIRTIPQERLRYVIEWLDGTPKAISALIEFAASLDQKRGSGRTTKAMKKAPRNAVYVVSAGEINYAQGLAASIDRRDLRIVGPSFLERERWRGIQPKTICFDHALYNSLTDARLREQLRWIEQMKKE